MFVEVFINEPNLKENSTDYQGVHHELFINFWYRIFNDPLSTMGSQNWTKVVPILRKAGLNSDFFSSSTHTSLWKRCNIRLLIEKSSLFMATDRNMKQYARELKQGNDSWRTKIPMNYNSVGRRTMSTSEWKLVCWLDTVAVPHLSKKKSLKMLQN